MSLKRRVGTEVVAALAVLFLSGLIGHAQNAPALALAGAKAGISSNSFGTASNFEFQMEASGWPRAVTAGETIFMMGSWPNGNNPTFTDDQSNAWAAVASCNDSTNTNHGFFYAVNAAANTSMITETHGSPIGNGVFDWAHFYNMSTTSQGFVDGSSCTTGVTPSSNTAPNISGPTYTTTASGDLILICIYVEQNPLGNPNPISSITFPSGFTGLSEDTTYGHACAYGVQTTAGPFTPTFTVAQSTPNSFTIMSAAFQAGAGGTAPGNGASVLLSEMHYVGAAGQTDTVYFPCPTGTTAIAALDDAGSLTGVTDNNANSWSHISVPGNNWGPVYYVNNPAIANGNTFTVSMTFGKTGGEDLVGLYCLGGTAGVDTAATAQNNSTLDGAGSGTTYNSATTSVNTIVDMPSIGPSVAGDLVLDTGAIGLGPAIGCVAGQCVFDYVSSTDWLNGDNESYANGDIQGHYYASTAGPVQFEFNVVVTSAGISGMAIAFMPEPIAAPTGLAITPSASADLLAWNYTQGNDPAVGFFVERATAAAGPFTNLTPTEVPVATPAYQDTSISGDVNYWYQVVAVDAAGNQSAPSNVISVTSLGSPGGTPSIVWPTPGAIAYGTPLGGAQLDAGASVPGTFVYSPAAGTLLGAGTQTLTVTFTPTDSVDYTIATASVTLQVNSATPSVTWPTPAAVTYPAVLGGAQLDASSSVPGTFVYSPPAGTVLQGGVQILSVTFTPTDLVDYTTATMSVALSVSPAAPTVSFTGAPASASFGSSFTVLATTNSASAATITASGACTVSGNTVTMTSGTGTCALTANWASSVDYLAAAATQSTAAVKATPVVAFTGAPASAGYNSTFSVSATANSGVTAKLSATGSCSISGTKVTITVASGTCSLTATWAANSNYLAATLTQATAAQQASVSLHWSTPAAISYGTALSSTQLDATASVAGSFVYSPASGAILTAGSQTLSVTFTPTNTTDYTGATDTVTLTVNPATPTITWPTPAAITYGTALSGTQLDASASVPGTLVYSPAAGTMLTAGKQTLSVTFTPTDNVDYATVTHTVTLTVNQVTPTVTWATPAAITYGTALSGTQLDASASVPGSFVYSPAAGAIEAGGSDTLSVTFTPTDSTDYKTVNASVVLVVNPATPTISWPTPAAITYGAALSSTQLDATAMFNGSSVAGTYVYTPAKGTVLTAGTQTLSVTFKPSNTADYSGATGSVSLQVNQASSSVSITSHSPSPSVINQAVTIAFTVTGTGTPTGTVTVTASTGPTCSGTLNSSGKGSCTITFTSSGSATLTAAYGGNTNLMGSTSAKVTQTVNP